MSKFCGLCGKPIESGNLCASCAPKAAGAPASPTAGKKAPKAGGNTPPKKSKKKLILAVIIILLIAVIAVVVAVAASGGDSDSSESFSQGSSESIPQKGDSPQSSSEEIIWNSSYEVPEIDAEAYYSTNGTVVSSVLAPESEAVMTERETYAAFLERELTQSDVIAQYDMEGNLTEERRISNFSDAKHPEYTAYYSTAGGDLWSITVINGRFVANPLSYNSKNSGVQVLIVEGDTLETYDSVTNKFFTVKPSASVIVLKTVARIDAQTLESLTEGAINAL